MYRKCKLEAHRRVRIRFSLHHASPTSGLRDAILLTMYNDGTGSKSQKVAPSCKTAWFCLKIPLLIFSDF